MRELTQEIKDLIKQQTEAELEGKGFNKDIVSLIIKQREELYQEEELEIQGAE